MSTEWNFPLQRIQPRSCGGSVFRLCWGGPWTFWSSHLTWSSSPTRLYYRHACWSSFSPFHTPSSPTGWGLEMWMAISTWTSGRGQCRQASSASIGHCGQGKNSVGRHTAFRWQLCPFRDSPCPPVPWCTLWRSILGLSGQQKEAWRLSHWIALPASWQWTGAWGTSLCMSQRDPCTATRHSSCCFYDTDQSSSRLKKPQHLRPLWVL